MSKAETPDCATCKVAPVCAVYAQFSASAEQLMGGAKQALPGWVGQITLTVAACPLYDVKEK